MLPEKVVKKRPCSHPNAAPQVYHARKGGWGPIASFLARLRSSDTSRRENWKLTPRAMRICFYAAVFLLFASVGVLVLLMITTYVSPLQIVLNIVIIRGFAIPYGAVSLWQRYWLIPVLVSCRVLCSAGRALFSNVQRNCDGRRNSSSPCPADSEDNCIV